jgi:Integrase zinc binding domain
VLHRGHDTRSLVLQGTIEGLELAILIARGLQWGLKDVTFHIYSQTTLRWIHSKKCKFEVFVANRIGKILRNTDRRQWRHVPGKCNPVDFCSRGVDPKNVQELEEFHLGPAFLLQDPSCWPSWEAIDEPDELDAEVIQVHALKIEKSRHPINELVERHSRLLVGWCVRYLNNLRARKKKERLSSGELTAAEMKQTLTICIRRTESIAFHKEIHLLSKGGDISSRSSIKCLTPYVDGEGLVRVGGRLENAPLDYDCRHPIVLPADQRLTHLVIWDYHVRNFHVKTERLLCDLLSKYWITSGRRVVRSVLNKCIPCKRRDARPEPPIMGPLPIHRLTPHVPVFGHTGVDYFGPL